MFDSFRKPFASNSERCHSDHGSRFRDKMSVVYDRSGGKHLEKVGTEDLYEVIQSHRDSVDLQKILQRCMMTGDLSALQKRQGVFGDFTNLPKDSRDYHQIMINAENIYNSLLDDVKKDLSFDSFLETFADPIALRKLVDSRKTNESEVVTDEQKQ